MYDTFLFDQELKLNFADLVVSSNYLNSFLINQTFISDNTSNLSNTNQTIVRCQKNSIMGSILQNASPYLYPFIVEYSLIAAAFLYIMWFTIGKRYSMVYEENSLSSVSCHQMPVDSLSTSSRSSSYPNFPALYSCLGSSKGLWVYCRMYCSIGEEN